MKRLINVASIVLAGGVGSRLGVLTKNRAKPAMPFAGNYRIIDFIINNLINSGIAYIKVLTQANFRSVENHVRELYQPMAYHGIQINPVRASKTSGKGNWYLGTADAVYQNLNLLTRNGYKYAVILNADHIFTMDVSQMLDWHVEKKADFTICAIPCPVEKAAGQFGVTQVDLNGRVIGFEEKPLIPKEMPDRPGYCLASMGNYTANIDTLSSVLTDDHNNPDSSHDLGKDVLPALLKQGYALYVYNFCDNTIDGKVKNYWRDVGTVLAYWKANMDIRDITPEIDLYNIENWPIRNLSPNLPGNKSGMDAKTDGSMISPGCILNGCNVLKSVLSSFVFVEKYSEIQESIIFKGVRVGENVRIKKAIIDEGVVIPANTLIGFNKDDDLARGFSVVDEITIVPKNYEFD